MKKSASAFRFAPSPLKRGNPLAILACAAMFSVSAAAVEPDTAPGNTPRAKAHQCVGCHEIPGYKTAFPSVYPAPKIFGQSAEYIVLALQSYDGETRNHPSMVGISAQLSADDIAEIAAFYADNGNPGEKSPSGAPPELAAACIACHGEGGNQPIANYPKLAGQDERYLVQAMRDYKTGARKNAVMAQQSAGWSRGDIAELAAYFAAQEGDLK